MSRRRKRDRRAHHAADPKRSDRLRRFLRLLKSRPGITTLELIKGAGVVAVSSIADELRKRGARIECWRTGGRSHWLLERGPR